jgi:uncharacterized membrane protein YheB (UPF0754 family)
MYSFIVTPLVTGLVGYCTNWLAIKMLFRPHKKSLLSFGWQGVIPKNRGKLASEIGVLVGDKLLRQNDIQSAFFSEKVQSKLEKAVEEELKNFLEKDFGTLEDIIGKTGYGSKAAISAFLETINQNGLLDDFFKQVSAKVKDDIFSFKIGELETYEEGISNAVKSILESGNIKEEAANSISASINNFVMSGKSLGHILPDSLKSKTGNLSEFITNKILESLDNAMSDENTRKKISSKLVDIKDGHFSGGAFDQAKLGFLNMFMNSDTINDLVDKYLPTLVTSLKNSDEVKGKITASIKEYIDGIIEKPLFMHADKIGLENIFQLKSTIVTAAQQTIGSDEFSDRIKNKIIDIIRKNSDKTLKDILDSMEISDLVSGQIESKMKPDMGLISSALAGFASKFHIKDIYSVIPKKLFYTIKITLIKEINKVVEKNSERMIEAINLPKITEDRINSLDLYEVENLLFSFMRDSFRWINVLGFILGFLFGAIQVGAFYLLG